jgi:hypothetical protein
MSNQWVLNSFDRRSQFTEQIYRASGDIRCKREHMEAIWDWAFISKDNDEHYLNLERSSHHHWRNWKEWWRKQDCWGNWFHQEKPCQSSIIALRKNTLQLIPSEWFNLCIWRQSQCRWVRDEHEWNDQGREVYNEWE